MPRLNHVKRAAKDNPVAKQGEPYYWWKFAYGAKQYSKERPRQSQLTQSVYYAEQWDAEDDMAEELSRIANEVRDGHPTLTFDAVITEVEAALQRGVEAGTLNADTLRENADSLESGFGHETEQVSNMRERADEYEAWSQELELCVNELMEPDTWDEGGREELAAAIESLSIEYEGS